MWEKLEKLAEEFEMMSGKLYKDQAADIFAEALKENGVGGGVWIQLAGKEYSWKKQWGSDHYEIQTRLLLDSFC